MFRDGWFQPIQVQDYEPSRTFHAVRLQERRELVRWRLYKRTGGGLMAELGSHQLDAASIFLGKVKPLSVMGAGTRSFFGDVHDEKDRPTARHRRPGLRHLRVPRQGPPAGAKRGTDKHDIVVVTYSSISTNGFEPYGESVMGTRGTLITASESELMLFKEQEPGKAESPETRR